MINLLVVTLLFTNVKVKINPLDIYNTYSGVSSLTLPAKPVIIQCKPEGTVVVFKHSPPICIKENLIPSCKWTIIK